MAQLVGLQRFDPKRAATWPHGSPAPLSFVAGQLRAVEGHLLSSAGRRKGVDTLCNLFRTLIVTSPADLAPLVCLLRDQVRPIRVVKKLEGKQSAHFMICATLSVPHRGVS